MNLAARAGIEPAALSSTRRRSTTELTNRGSGYEFRSRPIFAAGFRLARERARLLVWYLVPKATIRTRDPLLTRQPLFRLSYKGVIPFRLCPSASGRQAGQVLSLHMGGDPVHIPLSPFPRRARKRWCKGTPEMERKKGIEPLASTMAWSRSAH